MMYGHCNHCSVATFHIRMQFELFSGDRHSAQSVKSRKPTSIREASVRIVRSYDKHLQKPNFSTGGTFPQTPYWGSDGFPKPLRN